jgi:hypothetical protein
MTNFDLPDLIEQLEQAAAALTSDDLSHEQAAKLVADCARLAGEASAELDRRLRVQESLPTSAIR